MCQGTCFFVGPANRLASRSLPALWRCCSVSNVVRGYPFPLPREGICFTVPHRL